MNTADIVAGLSAVIAVGSAVWAARSARRANDAADRSASADERAAIASEEATAIMRAQAEHYQAPWRIRRIADGAYALVNDSANHEYGVELDAVNGGFYVSEFPAQTILKGSAAPFRASRDYDSFSDSIVVTWHRREDLTDPPNSWTWQLPG